MLFGWDPNPEETEKFVSTLKYPTLAGMPVATDGDILLYEYLLKVCPSYRRKAQGIGSCVGHGFSGGADILAAVEIVVHGDMEEWLGRTLEASIYAFSRVEARGRSRAGRSDGSYGSAAAKAVREWGMLHYGVDYNGTVFDEYSADREKSWGDTGVPDSLEPFAKKRLIRETALVENFDQFSAAIASGYPVPICSGVGFTMARDKDGFCSRQGSWSHCMVGIARRLGKRPGGLIWNSWGDNSNSGPHYPENMPAPFRGSTFWVDADVLDSMLGARDSFALSSYDGFPMRKLPNWTGGEL